jgi:hypothetical protein
MVAAIQTACESFRISCSSTTVSEQKLGSKLFSCNREARVSDNSGTSNLEHNTFQETVRLSSSFSPFK